MRKTMFGLFASTLLVLGACNQPVPPKTTGIEITSEPTKTEYAYGEQFDATGLVVSKLLDDESKVALSDSDYTLSGFDSTTPGEKEITATYAESEELVFTATFNVTVTAAPLVSIAVYALPKKVEYERNEEFKSEGLVIAGTYADGDVQQIKNYKLSTPDMSTSGEKVITVSVNDLTTSFKITVLVPVKKQLVVEEYPERTSYKIGEPLSLKGIKVSYLMSDKSYEEVLNYDVDASAVDNTQAGSYVVKISVGKEPKDMDKCEFNVGFFAEVQHTYNEYLAVSPSNWNELTYQDSNDTNIMSFINGNFFNFNFEYDDKGNIVEGGYQVEYDAVSALEDVTATYAGDENYAVPATATKGYAYKFTLRNDLRWDTGEQIKAADFVYTMKEQENPDFFNYRADSYYNGSTVIHNAKDYLFQGNEGFYSARSFFDHYNEADDSKFTFRAYPMDTYEDDDPLAEGEDCYVMNWFLSKYGSYKAYVDNYGIMILVYLFTELTYTPAELAAASAAMDGKTLAEIKADKALAAYWDALLNGFWKTEPDEELDLLTHYHKYEAIDFDKVGIFVGENDLDLIVVLDKQLNLFKEDGKTLSYKAAYNFSSLPCVKKDLYEKNKVAPKEDDPEGTLWTSKYNSSVETSASWGPYKLTYFQSGKQFILDRNPNWYGYNMAKYDGQYETDRIVCDTISQWNTAWLAFRQGDISSIGIDVSVASDYKNSSRAIFTADDYVGSMQLQSNKDALKLRESDGINKTILSYQDFRQALSLSIDRLAYTQQCTTASKPGLGIFNSMHYYDVENAGVYRDTDPAKEAICAAYGVDPSEFESLDAAYASITGYDIEQARELLEKAYAAALEAGDIKATDTVKLTLGSSADTEAVRRQFDFLKKAFEELAKGTSLEGRLTLELDTSFGSTWANAFRDGEYDICTGGWSGAAWDPGYFLLAYLSPDYMYSKAWKTDAVKLKLNPYDDGDEDHEYEMTLLEWYACLNGQGGEDAPDWSEGAVETIVRLRIIAALEEVILTNYYTVPMYNYYSASLLSYKMDYITTTYNTFMGYGGIRFIHYNYTDAQWEAVKGTFDYKK